MAGHLGMTVGDLLSRASSAELTEWQLYERLRGPLGPVRGDWHAAQVTAALVNANSKRKIKLRDALLTWGGKRATTDEDMERVGRMLAMTHGGAWTEGSGEGS